MLWNQTDVALSGEIPAHWSFVLVSVFYFRQFTWFSLILPHLSEGASKYLVRCSEDEIMFGNVPGVCSTLGYHASP